MSPCFDLISYDHDWGSIRDPKFHPDELETVKEKCRPYCSSTCYYTMGHYYDSRVLPEWVIQHIRVG